MATDQLTTTDAEQGAELTASPSSRRVIERPWAVRVISVLLFFSVIAAWQGAVVGLSIPEIILPKPSDVVNALWNGIGRGLYLEHLLWTAFSMLSGFLLAAVAGMAFGTLVAYSKWVDRLVYPYVIVFQSFPKIAIAPLLILWLGYGSPSKVVVAALTAFLPILSSVEAGLRGAEADQLDLMDSLQASKWESFRHVRFPAALPHIFSGLHVGLIFAMLGAIVAEFVGSRRGLGVLILNLNYSLDVAGVFSILMILAAMGVSLHLAVQGLRSRVVFWSGRPKDEHIETA